jgi:pyruvate,water dikinase
MPKLLEFFRRNSVIRRESRDDLTLERRYRAFKSLLAGNNQALELLTDLERLIYEGRSFTQDEALGLAETLVGGVYDLVEDLNALSGGVFPELFDRAETIGIKALRALSRRRSFDSPLIVLPLERLSLENLDEVGGKAANLGEVGNRVGLPTPQGFAVTASAAALFMRHSGLQDTLGRMLAKVDVSDTAALEDACANACRHVLSAPLPPELEDALNSAVRSMVSRLGPDLRLAVRSSAVCEDSGASFAGQHTTVLGVVPGNVASAWREVVASIFTPRAVFYRRTKGYSDQDVMMSVLVLAMVQARASGVAYTVDPNATTMREMLVSGVWGLGLSLVDGSVDADFWRVRRDNHAIVASTTARKTERLKFLPDGGTTAEELPEHLRTAPCLTPEQVASLAEYAQRLEDHYGMPLDVEWALDEGERFLILQTRPLMRAQELPQAECCEFVPGHTPLLAGGQAASPGTASGVAYVVQTSHALHSIPKGSILVAKQTSPAYVAAMGKVAGIVTDTGSVTGHMASVAREFGIPTLVGVGRATHILPHGQEITLDATNKVVYPGRVREILSEKKPVNLMKGSPVYKSLQEALKLIAPLNLVDPEKPEFTARGCRTLHDVIRFAHEMAMRRMFSIADDMDMEAGPAVPLFTGLPLNILVIDLGGGLVDLDARRVAEIEDIRCIPFKALLDGMRHPDIRWHGERDSSLSGFDMVVSGSVFRTPQAMRGHGGTNYAIISNEYMNFHGRMGHHFATVDTYCGPVINDNYVMFSFKGGAADVGRRTRRARLIAETLRWLGFRVVQKGDSLRAEIKKYDQKRISEKVDNLGRLLGAMRHLDMSLSDDAQIDWYVAEFLKGNYTFDRNRP